MCGNIMQMSERLRGSQVILAKNLPPLKAGVGECRTAEAIWDILRAFGHVAPRTPQDTIPTPQETTPTQQTTIFRRIVRTPADEA